MMTHSSTTIATPVPLFTPLNLGAMLVANRIMVSPMCQYSAVDGVPNDWHTQHYGALSLSGAALLCFEATHVSAVGRISPGCLGLWNDAQEAAFKTLLTNLRSLQPNAPKMMLQIAHAGRKGSSAPPWQGGQLIAPNAVGGWQPVAPSAVPHRPEEIAPTALSEADLDDIRSQFVQSAIRAVRAGFDAIELHAAHGYLLHQFLSPVANQRTDMYGGSLENRMRLPLEIMQAVRTAVPAHVAVGIRVSASDWMEYLAADGTASWTVPQCTEFVRRAKALGCDFVDVSSGGVSPLQKIEIKPSYQVHFATAIKQACGLPTISVGIITEPQQANAIVANGEADMVALARALLWNPRWGWHAAAELGATVAGIPQYARSLPAGKNRVFGDLPFGMR
jgi:2,4-dienoyl-CoA reductase-like NADH-dependent reductase (Old Yellow Enzyme family)